MSLRLVPVRGADGLATAGFAVANEVAATSQLGRDVVLVVLPGVSDHQLKGGWASAHGNAAAVDSVAHVARSASRRQLTAETFDQSMKPSVSPASPRTRSASMPTGC